MRRNSSRQHSPTWSSLNRFRRGTDGDLLISSKHHHYGCETIPCLLWAHVIDIRGFIAFRAWMSPDFAKPMEAKIRTASGAMVTKGQFLAQGDQLKRRRGKKSLPHSSE
jgi:hypothetical protein